MEYAEARCSEVKEQRGLMDLSITFLRGSVFGHPSLPVMGKFDRIHVGANCPKAKIRDLLRLLKPGGFAVLYSLALQSHIHCVKSAVLANADQQASFAIVNLFM